MRSRGLILVFGLIAGLVGATAGAQETPSTSPKAPSPSTPRHTKQRPAGPAQPNFGSVTTVFQRIPATDFDPDTIDTSGFNTPYTSTWNPPGSVNYRRVANSTTGFNHFLTSPALPDGALLTYIELDACDGSTTGNHVHLDVYNCDFLGACDATPFVSLVSTSNNVNPCTDFPFNAASYTVDNFLKQVLLDMWMDNGEGTFAGAIVGYHYQVSTHSGAPTFNDVPASDPAYQFIEALAASGITAGCGGGNYCPDNPLTRRQMAVFLAKGLGLNWGVINP